MIHKLVQYCKANLLAIAVACAVTSFLLEAFVFRTGFSLTKCFGAVVVFSAAQEKLRDNSAREKVLLKKGLTLSDIQNIEFVKNWDVIRKRGIYRYCFLDGAMMLGLILLLPIALFGLFLLNYLISAPLHVIRYLAVCLMLSCAVGAFVYLIRWLQNERRFLDLTDPLR